MNIKKILAAVVVMTIICCVGVMAFAETPVIDGVNETSAVEITSGSVEWSADKKLCTVTLGYEITGTIAEGAQLTLLGYVFDGDTTQQVAGSATMADGTIRAIDQDDAAATGTVVFSLAGTADTEATLTVSETAKMVVKLGTNAVETAAQAFYLDLAGDTDYPVVPDEEITEIVLTFTEEAGSTLNAAAVTAGAESYDVDGIDISKGGVNSAEAVLEAGDYTVAIDLVAADGYAFASAATATVNGESATVAATEDGVTVTYAFTIEEDAPETYTVTYKAGDGTGDDVVVENVTAGDYTLVAQSFTAPEGKEFDGWMVDGVKKAVGDTITVSANVEAVAQWKEIAGGGDDDNDDDDDDEVDPADVNNDGKKNAKDAVYLLRNTVNAGKYPINAAINRDMNNDGKVNAKDAVYLLRHTVNAGRYPLYPEN